MIHLLWENFISDQEKWCFNYNTHFNLYFNGNQDFLFTFLFLLLLLFYFFFVFVFMFQCNWKIILDKNHNDIYFILFSFSIFKDFNSLFVCLSLHFSHWWVSFKNSTNCNWYSFKNSWEILLIGFTQRLKWAHKIWIKKSRISEKHNNSTNR